jgi:hypothetical protein
MVNQRLVLDFVNTWDRLDAEEHLPSPDALASWLRERELLAESATVSTSDLREAKEVREALRSLLLANNDVEIDTAAAVATLGRAARRARLEPAFGGDEPLVARPARSAASSHPCTRRWPTARGRG